ncbi:MAG: hypothetical protein ACRD3N_06810 [Terracidiphilus sp.]
MVRLEDLVGKEVTLALIDSEEAGYDVVLHGVENGGIWSESNELEQRIGHRRGKSVGLKPAKKAVFFYPYSQIFFLVAYSTEL